MSSVEAAGFDEIRFPDLIEFDVEGGPRWSTTILGMPSGFEQRNENWEAQRAQYTATHKFHPGDGDDGFGTLAEYVSFFNSRRGKLRGFRFRDWTDYQASGEVCPQFNDHSTLVGDGVETEFQTAKTYSDVISANDYVRIIQKPVIETGAASDPDDPDAKVYLDTGGGPVLQTRTTDYTFDTTTGKITFTVAPPVDAVVTWTGNFDVPVRFDTDDLRNVLQSFDNNIVASIPIVEIRIP